MKILVAGGAGYIGSHMCKLLARHRHQTVVFDSFVTGHREAVRWSELSEGSLMDEDAVDLVFRQHSFEAVIHFAGSIAVGESVREPLAYYRNNVAGSLNLIQAATRYGVRRFVFSSTAAVYGQPQYVPLDESHPTVPVNPYGHTKLMTEQVLRDVAALGTLNVVCLRYFNAAGADPDAGIGEAHEPETHLIPLLLKHALGEIPSVRIFGDDYPTPDGTCIRDYVHIDDLCDAHLRALDYMDRRAGFHAFNLGNGQGYSVRQVVAAVENVIGRKLPVDTAPRRAGDPAVLVASSDAARRELGWNPAVPDIHAIIESAWRWHCQPRF